MGINGEIPVENYYREYSYSSDLEIRSGEARLEIETEDESEFDAYVQCTEGSQSLSYTAEIKFSELPRKITVYYNGEQVKAKNLE